MDLVSCLKCVLRSITEGHWSRWTAFKDKDSSFSRTVHFIIVNRTVNPDISVERSQSCILCIYFGMSAVYSHHNLQTFLRKIVSNNFVNQGSFIPTKDTFTNTKKLNWMCQFSSLVLHQSVDVTKAS